MKKVKLIGIGLSVLILSGCGSVFGVRNFEAWNGGPRWEFMEGQDFHVGVNGIDNVQDNRGVSSGNSRSKYAKITQ